MSISLSDCPICYEGYNSTDRVPRMLPCGHTFCSICITNLIKRTRVCPLDRQQFKKGLRKAEKVPKNIALLQIYDDFSKSRTSLCYEHDEPNSFVCLTENVKICGQCYDEKHKAHNVKHVKTIQREEKERLKKADQELGEQGEDYEISKENALNKGNSSGYKRIYRGSEIQEEKTLNAGEIMIRKQVKKDDVNKNPYQERNSLINSLTSRRKPVPNFIDLTNDDPAEIKVQEVQPAASGSLDHFRTASNGLDDFMFSQSILNQSDSPITCTNRRLDELLETAKDLLSRDILSELNARLLTQDQASILGHTGFKLNPKFQTGQEKTEVSGSK